ncbi:MAG: alanine racemase C-terminal domain-containing protein, partial [Chthoniobacterales bacterium]
LMLYGVSPLAEFQTQLRPALALKSRVVLVRDLPAGSSISYGRTFITQRPTRVATLGIGYADGYPRAISNQDAAVLIRGRRCPVLGRITMDLTMVDVTEVPDVSLGDEVVLIGRQGEQEVTAHEVAVRASTIPWEIFTGIGSRVARVYL